MGAKFDIEQADEVKRHLDKGFKKAAKRAALSTGIRIVEQIQAVVIPGEPRPPVDRGIYRAGWRASPEPYGASITNTVPYSPIVEWGARAANIKVGRAMIDALTGWVSRKGIGAGDPPRSVAWAIAMSMKRRGIFNGGKGLRIFEKGLRNGMKFFRQEMARELRKEMG